MTPLDEALSILWLETADSTNKELRKRLTSLDNLSIIAAKAQTAGRGQGDHVWFSSPETNLTFTILYRYGKADELKVADALLITQVTTLAILDYLLLRGINTRIKWPNDIWAGDRKICGILIENILNGQLVKESIVGIGLNVNQLCWPSYLPNPVSMKQLTGKDYVLEDELVCLQKEIRRRFGYLTTTDGRKSLKEEFAQFMFRLDA